MRPSEFRIVLIFLLGFPFPLFSQVPPDSLLQRIGFFKHFVDNPMVLNESNRKYIDSLADSLGFPIATHFYVKPDTLPELYAVTARHVLHYDTTRFKGSRRAVRIVRDTKGGRRDETLYYRVPRSNFVFYHPDSLVDLALFDLSSKLKFPEISGEYHSFSLREILTSEELDTLKAGQEVFYIGAYPDSVFSERLWYWYPHGTLKAIVRPLLIQDTTIGFRFKAEILLNIKAKGGVSGSPVLVRKNDEWKVLGIINGGNAAATLCTPAYRILEALEGRRVQKK